MGAESFYNVASYIDETVGDHFDGSFHELEVVQLWRDFLASPERFLRHLLDDERLS